MPGLMFPFHRVLNMAMRAPKVPRTADDLDALAADGKRYEIIDGEVFVSAAPAVAHQRILLRLAMQLTPYAEPLGIEVAVSPVDVRASLVRQVEPDVFALPRRHATRGRTRWEPMSRLLLAVEIVLPTTAAVDRGQKRQLSTSAGVEQYWIVDLDARTVEVCRPGATLVHVYPVGDALRWQPVAGAEALEIDMAALFEDVQ